MGFKLVGCTLSSSATILGGHFIGEKNKIHAGGVCSGWDRADDDNRYFIDIVV